MKYAHGKNVIPAEMTRDFVKKHEVFCEVDGEKIRITPSMIRKIKFDGYESDVYFFVVDDDKKAVCKAHKNMVDKENKRQERNGKCMIPNGKGKLKRCEESCFNCPYDRKPSVFSLNNLTDDSTVGIYIKDSAFCKNNPEDILMDYERRRLMWEYIYALPDKERDIVLMVSEGYTQKAIAHKIGTSQPIINKKIKKIFAEMKKFLIDLE